MRKLRPREAVMVCSGPTIPQEPRCSDPNSPLSPALQQSNQEQRLPPRHLTGLPPPALSAWAVRPTAGLGGFGVRPSLWESLPRRKHWLGGRRQAGPRDGLALRLVTMEQWGVGEKDTADSPPRSWGGVTWATACWQGGPAQRGGERKNPAEQPRPGCQRLSVEPRESCLKCVN